MKSSKDSEFSVVCGYSVSASTRQGLSISCVDAMKIKFELPIWSQSCSNRAHNGSSEIAKQQC